MCQLFIKKRLPLPHRRDKRSLCHITAIPLFLERERERVNALRIDNLCIHFKCK